MRGITAAITLALGLALAGPVAAQWGPPSHDAWPKRFGDTPWVKHPKIRDDQHEGSRHDGRRHSRKHDRRDSRRHRRYGAYVPYFRVYREDWDEAPAPPVVQAPPEQPQSAAPPEPVPPPDPRGPLRLTPARGVAPSSARWQVGAALPPGLPHVALDWRRYGLPEPPAGRTYARVGRDVLMITAAERVVESVVSLE